MAQEPKDQFKLVTRYGLDNYACGVKVGAHVMLKSDLVVRYRDGKPTGKVHPQGEVWIVLSGSPDDPGVIWMRDGDGDRCTWDDDATFFDDFEVLPANPPGEVDKQ